MDSCNRLQLLYCTDLKVNLIFIKIREKYSLQVEYLNDRKK